MNSVTPQPDAWVKRKYGTIRWFGGRNRQTGRVNRFGFIATLNGQDVYLHEDNWEDERPPEEADLVSFIEASSRDRYYASGARRLVATDLSATELYEALCEPVVDSSSYTMARSTLQLREILQEKLCECLASASQEELRQLVRWPQSAGSFSIFSFVSTRPNAAGSYRRLLDASGLRIGDNAPWAALTIEIASHFEAEIATYFEDLDPEQARVKLTIQLGALPASFLTHLLLKGLITTVGQMRSEAARVYDHLAGVLLKKTEKVPTYLERSLEGDGRDNLDRTSNPVLKAIIENFDFKRSLFDKDVRFTDLYQRSDRLDRNVETFTLYNLISLILAGNEPEVVYGVFLKRLWDALAARKISFERVGRLRVLFPSCATMFPAACEAVHWRKQNLFLCRGKVCKSPEVMPVPGRHFMDFSIYDWLSHYGVNCLISGKPHSRDLPIKLAGYTNRLTELLQVLNCRACQEVMLPDMKYARTEYNESVGDKIVVKEMAAAYRTTVFYCNKPDCSEHRVGHYINHCLGFGCYRLIDSRDAKQRCANGRYICGACASCCSNHEESHPLGFCPECGAILQLRRVHAVPVTARGAKALVTCASNSCAFKFGPTDLPKKFRCLPIGR